MASSVILTSAASEPVDAVGMGSATIAVCCSWGAISVEGTIIQLAPANRNMAPAIEATNPPAPPGIRVSLKFNGISFGIFPKVRIFALESGAGLAGWLVRGAIAGRGRNSM